ncbi:MAG: methionyl-tRNA formyltransferase [Candidatus Cryosericum sp.]
MLSDELRVAVFGSSAISVPVFDAIAQQHSVVLTVVSDSPTMRHGKTVPNPVQQWAEARSIPVLNGAITSPTELIQGLTEVHADILFLLSYGRLLPGEILNLPRVASINLHPSLLPWYRGAAPIERQIMEGCTESAVSIIRMNTQLDRGELLAQQPFDIRPEDYRVDVEASIIRVGTPLALEVIEKMARGAVTPLPQVGAGSYARKLKADDELIDWSLPAQAIFNLIRALAPEPGASTFQGNERIKILRAIPLTADVNLPPSVGPGYLALLGRKRAAVRCGDGWLELLRLQLPGKPPMSMLDLLNGRRLLPGSIFFAPPSP